MLLTCQYQWVRYDFTLMSTPVTWRTATEQNISLVTEEVIKMLALQSKIEVHHIKTICFRHEQELLKKFSLQQKIVVIQLTFIQTSKGQNNCRSWVAMRNWKIHFQMIIPSEKHCSTCVIRLNKEIKDMPNAAQTGRSTKPNAAVQKHEKEELMDICY